MAGASSLRVTQVALRNYKSIEQCEIELHPLTVLVGRNGAGKSNIIDALRFVNDSLQNTLEYAIRERGGIAQVRRKSLGERPRHPGVALRLRLEGAAAEYAFQIAAEGDGFSVERERCVITQDSGERVEYDIQRGGLMVWTPPTPAPAGLDDRLLLVSLSGMPQFRPVYDALTRMVFHNLNPAVMKAPQRPDAGEQLARDGHNLASVIKRLQATAPEHLARAVDYLRAIGVPVVRVGHKSVGSLETVELRQEVARNGAISADDFDAITLSDGTIRALGILVSLASANGHAGRGPTLVAIEEPEAALHPAAAGALMDALLEAAGRVQILVSCHSPDLIDHSEVTPEMIRVVLAEQGRTVVGPLSATRQQLLRDHLHTPGELLRLDQLTPDPEELRRQGEAGGTLFEALA